ncbi:MAG: phage integrase SAM-like domain-containing protein, partial [Alphaproteobacteria bacterium]|nr:phage integrase SAM-like domain-containing protein [Alphaproteobacteria bacterium]
MVFMKDSEHLKSGLVIFRRTDVKHDNWYCRVRVEILKKYKTISLKTRDINEARERAFDIYSEIRFKIKNEVPVFDRRFSDVAREFLTFQKERSEAGEISHHRWRVMNSHVKTQLSNYVGAIQITQISEERWKNYATWRRKSGKGRSGGRVSDGTIRDEMATLRSIMRYAASKKYIRDSQIFRAKLLVSKAKREEFSANDYRAIHTYARRWVKKARDKEKLWYRTVIYNFILIMTNTGMRVTEARSLKWRDCSLHADDLGRRHVRLNVWGKGKRRTLVAADTVWDYLERIREIRKSLS